MTNKRHNMLNLSPSTSKRKNQEPLPLAIEHLLVLYQERAAKKNEASAKQLEINASLALFPTVFVPTQVIRSAPTLNELTDYMMYNSCLTNCLHNIQQTSQQARSVSQSLAQ